LRAPGGGGETVEVRTGASLVRSGECPVPTFLEVDVEGAEAEALAGMVEILPPAARLLIGMHTREADRAGTALLERAGFELIASRGLEGNRSGRWVADPDLYAIGPACPQPERDRALLREHRF
jgi:hypothetical protein